MKYNLSDKADLRAFNMKVDYLLLKGKMVDLKSVKAARSISQNSYLHVVISIYAIEFGYTFFFDVFNFS